MRRAALRLPGRIVLLMGLLWGVSSYAHATDLELQVRGVKGALAENVTAYLSSLEPVELARWAGLQPQLEKKSRQAMEALGYFHAKIDLSHTDRQYFVTVAKGAPVRVSKVQITLEGEAKQDSAFEKYLANLPVKVGDILDQGKYRTIKNKLVALASNRGYPDAQFSKAQLIVNPQSNQAQLLLTFDSGVRYQFGEIRLDSPYDKLPFMQQLITIRSGEPYLASKLSNLGAELSRTQYFQRTEVVPLWGKAKGRRVPIQIHLTPKSANTVAVGAGYSTDEGPRMKLEWKKPWVNDYGHSFSSAMSVSAPKQKLSFDYQIPDGNPLNRFYSLQSGYQHLDQNDTFSSKFTVAVNHQNRQERGWSRNLFVRLDREIYTQGEDTGDSLLVIPGVTYSRTRLRGGMDPYWGDRMRLTVEAAPPGWGANVWLTKVYGETKWLRRLGEKNYFITRLEQGAIFVDDPSEVPASMRFFAGGDQSVRGFSYNSISPTDSTGQLSGARYLTTASLEYQYQFAPKWRVALFADTGTATNDYEEPFKVGVGPGLRWMTPVGPISIDLAFGVSETEVPVRIHFSMGPEL
ncbi:autotransporter assembly complex protein TamA [Dongshaea marina]|uniref:autotransporter assembly complex protein TamA n=1 Tax=Dongshaea marina TaxID=2047966 RepID=UPI00131EE819|nr:autotransporter assembly complex family protein [Dongshaea marina]